MLLNGEPIKLTGFGKHEDFPLSGRGQNLPMWVRDHELLKWVGASRLVVDVIVDRTEEQSDRCRSRRVRDDQQHPFAHEGKRARARPTMSLTWFSLG
ncbi:glycoside hydrolase family 2 TIM barrel-domain containing protein [Limnoglobus roseus]|uniref:glycoside hydrolase family 2 TIM barrel-domain containing protein n=1 Tax=Limnoglobus roseus TaxID=2598579 RepID=UPI001C49A2DC